MNRMIFVNLPVADLRAARTFYTGLGFRVNEQFSDDSCACIVISDTISVMLLVHDRFRDFIRGEISDATAATEVINCLSAESREEVDTMVARARLGRETVAGQDGRRTDVRPQLHRPRLSRMGGAVHGHELAQHVIHQLLSSSGIRPIVPLWDWWSTSTTRS